LSIRAVADAHVDVLWRMDKEGWSFYGESPLMASYARMRRAGVQTQVFALFSMPDQSADAQLEQVMRCIDLFYHRVVQRGKVRAVSSREQLEQARAAGEIAAVLSLEGGGCLRGQTSILRVLHRLGVCGVGLTWNAANELADGCGEPRDAGLTAAGRDVVRELARLGMWVDIAHLGDQGVRDVLRLTDGPVMASHANARAVYEHRRNLPDPVIRELVHRGGWIGLTFEASFVANASELGVEAVFRHLDHMLDLGAKDCLGFGSDFDGTSHPLPGLADMDDYPAFAESLHQRYGDALARKLLFENFDRFLKRVWS
jgi:membrane dipeptidase